jgi:hypothetical protein
MQRVRIPLQTPGNIIWPHRCACCGDAPDTFVESKVSVASAMRQWTLALRIPYCSACEQHVRAVRKMRRRGILYVLLLLFVGLVLGLAGYGVPTASLGAPPWLGGIVAVLLVVGFFLLWRRMRRRGREQDQAAIEKVMKPTCTAEDIAVVVSTDSANLYFRFENPDLAEEFRSANGGAWWGG